MKRALLEPVAIGVVLAVIGGLSLALRAPLLVPSIASAAFVQVMTPRAESGRPWNIAVGQLLGGGLGILAVHALGAAGLPAFTHGHVLAPARLLAAAAAAVLTAMLQRLLHATSAAGAATALVVALGTETANWPGALRLGAAILLVTLLGEGARRLMLRLA